MLTVCNFHYIRSQFNEPFPSIFGVTPSQFEHQLQELAKTGEFISQAQLLNQPDLILNSAQNYILITFDDGLKEQFVLAKPLLDKLKIPAVYFINSLNFIEKEVTLVHKIHLLRSQIPSLDLLAAIEKRGANQTVNLTAIEKEKAVLHYNYDDVLSAHLKYLLNFKWSAHQTAEVVNALFVDYFDQDVVVSNLYMTEEQLQELSSLNMLGNHTHNHFALGLLPIENIADEITKTKKFIDNFGHAHQHSISYPFGSQEACQNPVQEVAQANGYRIGFTMERGINDFKTNQLLLKRFDCNDLPGGKNYNSL
jgi:peptidoglycan/xylan/chitin deacetylase (PgdA/CDA1 family)